MCEGCWIEAGSPAIDTPSVRRLAALTDAAERAGEEFGALHIVISDWNVEDEHLLWCIGPENSADVALTPEGAAFAAFALQLSEVERTSALALNAGYWASSGNS